MDEDAGISRNLSHADIAGMLDSSQKSLNRHTVGHSSVFSRLYTDDRANGTMLCPSVVCLSVCLFVVLSLQASIS